MKLVDTHCHLASARFQSDIDQILSQVRAAGVGAIITQSTNLEDLEINLSLAERFEEVFVAAGIHPCDVHELADDFDCRLEEVLGMSKVVAVGETGLDYFHPAPEKWTEDAYRARQRDFLRKHFQLADKFGLPVVLHTRDREGSASFDDALEIASDFAGRVKFVFHCFPGPTALARRALDAGAYLSFTGIATFKNARDCLDAALMTPQGRMMVETDAPYLAPVPHRGKTCQPAYVADTARFLAERRGESFDEFCEHTSATAREFFRFP